MMPLRVLLVDDSQTLRMVLAEWLAGLPGVSVIAQAGSGDEALGLVDEVRPNFVLTDVDMPGMSGFEFTFRIRHRTDAPRVAIMSASKLPHYRELCRRAGADIFIDKKDLFGSLARYLKTEFGAGAFSPSSSEGLA